MAHFNRRVSKKAQTIAIMVAPSRPLSLRRFIFSLFKHIVGGASSPELVFSLWLLFARRAVGLIQISANNLHHLKN